MTKPYRFVTLITIILVFAIGAGALFYQKQSSASVELIKNDLGQDIANSQLLQAERRVEILRRLGFYDLKLSYSNFSNSSESNCKFGSVSPINVDGVQVGSVSDCPRLKTITYFLFGSSIFKFGFLAFFLVVLVSITIPLYRYKKSIQEFIQNAKKKDHAFFESHHALDPVVEEIQKILNAAYLSRSQNDRLEFENRKSQALADLARQVAHDIRSPLSALNIAAQHLENVGIQKDLIQSATLRINEIANDLLRKNINSNQCEILNTNSIPDFSDSEEPVTKIIHDIVMEKKVLYSANQNIHILSNIESAQPLICTISAVELKRIVSNLINNSVEAFSGSAGNVTVGLRTGTKIAHLTILDDGHGIPQHILSKIGQKGFSYGKSGAQSGFGLGMFHAKSTVETLGGSFSVQSQEGVGTMISITIPTL